MLALPNNRDEDQPADDKAAALARVWLARLEMQSTASAPVLPLPMQFSQATLAASLAELVALVLGQGKTLLLILPDDQLLPEISNALDLVLRPLCLVLPAAPFAARVVVRATLSLLKSRLGRGLDEDAESGQVLAWRIQHDRIAARSATWQTCLAWAANNEAERNWPDDLVDLFPIGIGGGSLWQASAPGGSNGPSQAVAGKFDYAVALTPARLPDGFAQRQLLLQALQPRGGLARSDEEALLRAELAMLTQEVGDMELELATIQSEVGEFARHYYERIGALLTELDSLRAQLANDRADLLERAERADGAANNASPASEKARQAAHDAHDRADRSRREHAKYADYAVAEAPPFRPSRDIKRLFRRIAQKIHPDRADDEDDRHWRTQLMTEANRAYRCSDEAALREVLARWQRGPGGDKDPGTPESLPPRQVLAARIENMRRRLAEIEAELRRLFTSPLYELFIAARLARRQGRELLEEMASDLTAQIAEIRRL
jgi:hypothetical protein